MAVFYVESSAYLKRYRSEKGTPVVNEIFAGKTEGDDIVTSQLIAIEVEAALARAVKARAIDERTRGAILRGFADDLQSLIIIPISLSLVNEASRVARQYALRALDAIHFATAQRVSRTSSPEFVLVASDKDIVQAGPAAGLTVLNPEDGSVG